MYVCMYVCMYVYAHTYTFRHNDMGICMSQHVQNSKTAGNAKRERGSGEMLDLIVQVRNLPYDVCMYEYVYLCMR